MGSLQGAREESLHLLRRFYKVSARRNYTSICPLAILEK